MQEITISKIQEFYEYLNNQKIKWGSKYITSDDDTYNEGRAVEAAIIKNAFFTVFEEELSEEL